MVALISKQKPTQSELDHLWMREVIRLARRGEGRVSPNPLVGAVFAKGERLLGRGYHARAGNPHAEIMALRDLKRRGFSERVLKGATLYVNLEPCCIHGRTPPCTEALLPLGLDSVVVGIRDPNPKVNGRGIRILEQGGVRVRSGVMKAECDRLNEIYCSAVRLKRPFIALKLATSLDGMVAMNSGESKWITSEASRRRVQALRNRYDGVMTGVGTVLADDPRLNVRLGAASTISTKSPWVVIWDSSLRTPLDARLFRHHDPEKIVFICKKDEVSSHKHEAVSKLGCRLLPFGRLTGLSAMERVLQELWNCEIRSLMIEAGPRLASSFLQAGLVDKVHHFIAPKFLGGASALHGTKMLKVAALGEAPVLRHVVTEKLGPDVLVEGSLAI